MATTALQAERFEIPDDIWAAQAFFEEKGWGDGLPIIPPTEERVAQMLAAAKRKADEVIGAVPPRWAQATVEKIAINGVMKKLDKDNLKLTTNKAIGPLIKSK